MNQSLPVVWIVPIDSRRREEVVEATHAKIALAARHLRRQLVSIPVLFDLKGRSAGMYRVKDGRRVIRYNPYLFAKYYADSIGNTVAHEVAHYVVDVIHGLRFVRPHGEQWRAVMAMFGEESARTCRYDMTGIPVRRQRRFSYGCGCTTYELSSSRHNKVRRGGVRYSCRRCGMELTSRHG